MEFFSWFYTKGLDYYLTTWAGSINWTLHYFSPGLLLRTLFSPWKRMIEDDSSPGFNFQKKFEVFTFNLISRGVGAAVRMTLFLVSIVFLIFSVLGGALGFVFWMIMPFFGIPVFNKHRNQPVRFAEDLLYRLKSSSGNPVDIIFGNDAGKFVLDHVGLTKESLLEAADVKQADFAKLEADDYQDIISFLVDSNVWKDEFYNKHEIKKTDLVQAAVWWDEKRKEETEIGTADLGRPGLALELTFGYTPTLNKYSVDLSTPQSYSHRLIGRQPIVERMVRVINSGNSVLLVGMPGVGRKTVALEFAHRAAAGQLGPEMSYKRVLELDYNSLLSESKDLNLKKKYSCFDFTGSFVCREHNSDDQGHP